jgi:hypothetical protein
MNSSTLLRRAIPVALAGAWACADVPAPTTPTMAPGSANGARAAAPVSSSTDENYRVSPELARLNASLAARGANFRVASAELRIAAKGWNGVTSTILIANDRDRGIGAEWVKGDPRRDGRTGVTWAFGSNTSVDPYVLTSDGSSIRAATKAEQLAYVQEATAAWSGLSCSSKPITQVAVPAGTDPDYLDEYFRGNPAGSPNYVQPADIVETGWQPPAFFRTFGGADGDYILGVTFPFIFTDDAGNPTDIDGNGKADLALSEIYYNPVFVWGSNGDPQVIDFYSILTHETGHALGLGHFGKVFVTKQVAADGISISDVKYAPYAMMNAVYVAGRNEIAGTDNSQFCQIWASR